MASTSACTNEPSECSGSKFITSTVAPSEYTTATESSVSSSLLSGTNDGDGSSIQEQVELPKTHLGYVADHECSIGVVGTGSFRAPEILQACKDGNASQRPDLFSKAADVYGYGMTCFEVLTGNIPFERLQAQSLMDRDDREAAERNLKKEKERYERSLKEETENERYERLLKEKEKHELVNQIMRKKNESLRKTLHAKSRK